MYFNCDSAFNAKTTFNLSTGVVSNTGTGSATITSAGSGWYRCTITGTATITNATASIFLQVNNTVTTANDDTFTGDGTSGIFLWGAQLETSTFARTYQVTTTAAASANPKINLSGGGSIGLESTGSLYIQPAGTGALQAQATTSTAVGGNARGANAVDWQTARDTAAKVASGTNSTIGGGTSNSASAGSSFVGGGSFNSATNSASSVVGGSSNSAAGYNGFVGGGSTNQANGYFNAIVGGVSNSGTSASAVTTNTTTIALTAATTVYLSSTNANIKVGQILTGTGVTNFTYATSTVTTGTPAVMNTSTISGTTLTVGSLASGTITAGQRLTGTGITAGTYIVSGSGLSWTVNVSQTVASTTITGTAYTFTISQNATTAAGVTLSFYTPHGVVVGGGNNQATGSYSFIGGGGDAGTAANRNAAIGDWSTIAGGYKNIANGNYNAIAGGNQNTTSGVYASVGGGLNNNAANSYNVVAGGYSNSANSAQGSAVLGGLLGTTRSIVGYFAFPACATPIASTQGATQSGLLLLGRQTTDATATVLCSDANAAGSTNQVILPNNSVYYFTGEIVAGVTGGGNTKGWNIAGVIKRGANAAATSIVGTATVTSSYADAGASTWAVTATADTTNGGLKITVTGQAATTIRWVAQIRTTEMTY